MNQANNTLKDHVARLFGSAIAPEFPTWPPDVFAVTADILRITDTYHKVVDIKIDNNFCPAPEKTEQLGREWFKNLIDYLTIQLPGVTQESSITVPEDLRQWWSTIIKCDCELNTMVDLDERVITALIGLCLAADEASKNISLTAKGRITDAHIESMVWKTLYIQNQNLSLCENISPQKLRVLPKSHTPDCGMTLRSISHYLALVPNLEVHSNWVTSVPKDVEQINLLLLPWPLTMKPSHFTPEESSHAHLDKKFGYFNVKKPEYPDFKATLYGLIEKSKEYAPKIHGIVMPELSISTSQYSDLQEIAMEMDLFICAGIMDDLNHTNTLAWNLFEDKKCLIDERQSKHHRWALDANQLQRYGLSAFLSPNKRWWEFMNIEKRNLNFFNYGHTTICTLICEDLARQDPAASIIRAIAPNMVIALLMDGPQLASRWPARYASILADDPGCSVLTFTSFGLIDLSNKTIQQSHSRVVALWRDRTSFTKEITLGAKDQALLLTLTPTDRREVSADGRSITRSSSLIYSGHHGLSCTPKSVLNTNEQS